MITIIISAIVLFFILFIGFAAYIKAPPNKAYIITGPRKKSKVLIGKAGFKIPFIDRMDKLDLSLIPVDVRTTDEVPTIDYIDVKVNANVNVRVGQTDELLSAATTHFLNMEGENIGSIARETLEASVREIIGMMRLEDMVTNRAVFTEKVMATAVPDMAKLGLEIVSFNVQSFADKNGVIENLGVDNVVRIQKNAAISRAESEKEIAVAKAKAAKEANDAKAAAQEEIAKRNAQLDMEQAKLKTAVDTQQAQADAAKLIESENQRKLRDIAATNANIAKAEREAELKQKQIELREYELTAVVRKQADAEKYAAEKQAEADLIRRQKDAEAKAYEIQQEAMAARTKAEADRYAAEQQAAGIASIGAAEAEAILKKAEAQKQMGEASVLEMYLDTLPKIVANVAAPLTNVDKITMYGEGNNTKLIGDIMNSTNQVMEAMKANGIDLGALLTGFFGGKAAQ